MPERSEKVPICLHFSMFSNAVKHRQTRPKMLSKTPYFLRRAVRMRSVLRIFSGYPRGDSRAVANLPRIRAELRKGKKKSVGANRRYLFVICLFFRAVRRVRHLEPMRFHVGADQRLDIALFVFLTIQPHENILVEPFV